MNQFQHTACPISITASNIVIPSRVSANCLNILINRNKADVATEVSYIPVRIQASMSGGKDIKTNVETELDRSHGRPELTEERVG